MSRTAIRPIIALVATCLTLAGLGLVAPASATARTSLDSVASSLRQNPVYNDTAAENALTPGQAADLRAQITSTGIPIYVAVLPESAATETGGPDELLRDLRNAVGRSGVYAVVAGNSFRAASTEGSVTAIADAAFESQSGNGPYAVLEAFVAGVDEQASGTTSSATESSSGGGIAALVILFVLLTIVAIAVLFAVRHSRRVRARQVAAVRGTLDEDVTALGERLGAFDVTDPRLDDAGRADLQQALDSYARASDTASRAVTEADLTRAASALEDGRYALACVEARVAGEPIPVHRAPCFVDPRHGPSTNDVTWAPDGGAPHPVPVCAVCTTALQSGSVPDAREVDTAGGRVPYWRADGYAPYARGYYSSFGSILPALFMGTMLASAFSVPAASASTMGGDSGGSDGFGGGDFGGGGFGGGGDFGGGGFGGGDF
ncbi:MAG: hypothetical protein NWQ12_05520 [Candidatus Nanopelagicales bacterium]|jgi:hypothetical protein|nr:hypothetical protein [Candidatus Nanopelagicales bacterium]